MDGVSLREWYRSVAYQRARWMRRADWFSFWTSVIWIGAGVLAAFGAELPGSGGWLLPFGVALLSVFLSFTSVAIRRKGELFRRLELLAAAKFGDAVNGEVDEGGLGVGIPGQDAVSPGLVPDVRETRILVPEACGFKVDLEEARRMWVKTKGEASGSDVQSYGPLSSESASCRLYEIVLCNSDVTIKSYSIKCWYFAVLGVLTVLISMFVLGVLADGVVFNVQGPKSQVVKVIFSFALGYLLFRFVETALKYNEAVKELESVSMMSRDRLDVLRTNTGPDDDIEPMAYFLFLRYRRCVESAPLVLSGMYNIIKRLF